MQLTNYWSGFREELMATSLVLVVAMGGSFFIAHRLLNPQSERDSNSKAGAETSAEGIVLGEEISENLEVEVTQSQLPTNAVATPTINQYATTVLFGSGGSYDHEAYTLEVINPRLEFDARTNLSRKFLVDLKLTNKAVVQGLFPKFTAAIVKDGVVIVPAAVLSVTPNTLILPGQTTMFTARISLIEGTDIREIGYTVNNDLPIVVHPLSP